MKLKEMTASSENNNLAKSYLKSLLTDNGWFLVVEVLQQNITTLTEQILNGSDGGIKLSPEELDRKRDKLQAYKEAINTPNMLLDRLEPATHIQEETDPYDTVESLKDGKDN